MKIIFFVLSILFLSFAVYSNPIDVNTASSIASKYIENNIKTTKRGKITLELHHTSTHTSIDDFQLNQDSNPNLFYIFNFSNANGFIIISADDRIIPILGYSSESDFNMMNVPKHVLSWLNKYNYQIAKIITNDNAPIHPKWDELKSGVNSLKRGSAQQVNPLLKTTWDQTPFYNYLCPIDPKTKNLSVTGCVATAMAQTLKYWNYPSKGMGKNQYTLSGFGTLTTDFSKSIYDWANMPTSINSVNPSIALLMKDCGYASSMQYSSIGSGAWVEGRNSPTAESALINNFGYSPFISFKLKDSYTDAEWINLIKGELDSLRPIIYDGYTSDLTGGHCFVADGYDLNNLIHFNWGWGGYGNGYFYVNNLSPDSKYNFSTKEGALFGIKPATCSDGIIGNSEICLGTTSNLDHLIKGGTWSSSDISVADVTKDGVVYTNKIGSVIITYTLPDNTSCSKTEYSKTINIVGAPLKPKIIFGDSTMCQLETKTYSVDKIFNGNWSTYNTNINVFNDGKVQGLTAGKALLTFNYGNVCYHDTVNKWINVKATPVIPIIKGVDSLCVNALSQYSNTVTNGIWTTLDNYSSTSLTGILKGLNAGITTLVYSKKGTNGCVGKASKKIKIKAIPLPIILGQDSLCLNSKALYTSTLPNGTWTTINSNISITNGNVLAKTQGASGVKYALTLNGCANTVTKNIYVKPLPSVGTLSVASSFCGSSSTNVTSTVKGGVWSISNTPIFNINQNGVISSNNTVSNSAIITYTTKANNCYNSTTKTISVVALPNVTITGLDTLNIKQQYTYKASVTGGVWSVLDSYITTNSQGLVTGISENLGVGSTLKYVITGSGVCAGKISTATKNIKVISPSKLLLSDVYPLNIYPNPTSGIINISNLEKVNRILLIDMTGRVIKDNQIYENTVMIDYSEVIRGKYLLVIKQEDNTESTLPIMIE